MNCHIVPKVYLKSWKQENEPLYIFNKANINIKGTPKNIKMKDTSFASENLYLLNAFNANYSHALAPEYEKLYSLTSDYSMKFGCAQISTLEDFILWFSDFSKWEIRDKTGAIVASDTLRKQFDSIWTEHVTKKIETYFDQHIENYWNTFLEYVNNRVCKCNYMVQAKYKDIFFEFVAIQMCRVFKNMRRLGVDKAIHIFQSVFSLPDDWSPDQEKMFNEIFNNEFKDDLSLIQLYKYVYYKESGDESSENNSVSAIVSLLYSQMQVIMLICTGKSEFIVTDCPCLHISLVSKFDQHFSGIYLPITPKVCAFIAKSADSKRKNKYLIVDVCDTNVGYINYMMMKECQESIVYSKDSLDGLMCKTPDINNWITQLSTVDLIPQKVIDSIKK